MEKSTSNNSHKFTFRACSQTGVALKKNCLAKDKLNVVVVVVVIVLFMLKCLPLCVFVMIWLLNSVAAISPDAVLF